MANETIVHDKAKWHYGGEWPKGLPLEQAYVHTGMFVGWLIDAGLVDAEFADGPEIAEFKARKLTGAGVYKAWDGALVDDQLTDEGNAFAEAYFDFQDGKYLSDYEELLAPDLPSLYAVPDTWENYELLKRRIDERFAAWRKAQAEQKTAAKKKKPAKKPVKAKPKAKAKPKKKAKKQPKKQAKKS